MSAKQQLLETLQYYDERLDAITMTLSRIERMVRELVLRELAPPSQSVPAPQVDPDPPPQEEPIVAIPRKKLTAREREVMGLIAEGHTTKEVAALLGITFKTAACHRYRIMDKLKVHSIVQLVRYADQSANGHGGASLHLPGVGEPGVI